MEFKLKNDQFRRSRGGQAELLDILCAGCGHLIMVYQKDGTGQLHRCYLNRIFYPPHLERLQHDPSVKNAGDLQALWCDGCNKLIASPMLHWEGRLAFRLHYGMFAKRKHKK